MHDPLDQSLAELTSSAIDGLPFGYMVLAKDGTVVRYNRYEAQLARVDADSQIGRNFFSEVAPCTQVQEFQGRFRDFATGQRTSSTLSFEFVFKFRHGRQNVRIGFVATGGDDIIVTVNRLRSDRLALSLDLEGQPEAGVVRNAEAQRILLANDDLLRGLASVLAARGDRDPALVDTGIQWGLAHAQKGDNLLQQESGTSLRDTELGAVTELLTSSVAALGLGRPEVDFTERHRGLIVVRTWRSPFVEFFPEQEGGSCALLVGLWAGIFSYLAGRRLTGREIYCSRRESEPCVFVIATDKRLESLAGGAPGSDDLAFLIDLRERAQS